VTSRERMPQLPDVASFAESVPEMKDYELLNWFALFATAGTPAPVVARLNRIANAALRDPAVAHKLEVQGIVPRPMSPVEFRAFVDAEVKKFGEIMTRANIHAEN
jgi:tripartite-type tricarboxylate transporter receptor subunit TctC